MTFETFFKKATGFAPHPWQRALGESTILDHRLIRIPTGLGKTMGVATAWLYHRVHREDLAWPTRLVWVLPMRVLVEQTLSSLSELAAKSDLDVQIVPCMGGLVDKEYALTPSKPAILVGTQDMLVSRALMRGYAAARGRWPVDFGLLSRDTLTVCDEIQLMDASLPTTVQLAAFRGRDGLRPSRTWWMSATLQSSWLNTVDFADEVDLLASQQCTVPPEDRAGGPWSSVKHLALRDDLKEPKAMASAIAEAHRDGTITLVIVNRVDRAIAVHKALAKLTKAERQLVHSRFRPAEREGWQTFLHRAAERPEAGRIVVATQVVEAGVDISAELLITDLAPWASLVQRFGRAARYPGEQAQVWVSGPPPVKDKDALPYAIEELDAAWSALGRVEASSGRVDLASLAVFDESLSADDATALFPPPEGALLRRTDLHDLFDTTPDLSGSDIDVAPFIRTGDTRDISVFWREIDEVVPADTLPHRAELCRVPIAMARKWLEKQEQWWILDYADGWIPGTPTLRMRLVPGRTVLVPSAAGGYNLTLGFDSKSKQPVPEVPRPEIAAPFDETAARNDSEALSTAGWRTIATHGDDTARFVERTSRALALPEALTELLALAGRWHDVGKSHATFQHCVKEEARAHLEQPDRADLAKAPAGSWRFAERRGFRHELASALGLLELLRRRAPDHPALTGDVAKVLQALGHAPETADLQSHPLADEIALLSADDFNLLLWLVVTHHGKVRSSWSSTKHDQATMTKPGGPPLQIHGIRSGDTLPELEVATPTGHAALPSLSLDLAISQLGLDPRFGASWSERAEDLLRQHGPFDLAFMEALLRSADVRASQLTNIDPRVSQ
jgi:CRISPR-associated endonuclease/helicase Cas3